MCKQKTPEQLNKCCKGNVFNAVKIFKVKLAYQTALLLVKVEVVWYLLMLQFHAYSNYIVNVAISNTHILPKWN